MVKQQICWFIAVLGFVTLLPHQPPKAATNWPRFQNQLRPAKSSSSHEAKIPDNTAVTPPAPNVPAHIATYSGIWKGWMCRNATTSIVIAVKTLSAESASIGYAVATSNGKPIWLEYVVFRPAGDGPFPVLVFNHGSTGHGKDPERFTRTWRANSIASLFVKNGWAVVFPQRRGRGRSDGLYDEGFYKLRWNGYACEPRLSLPGLDRALTDIHAAIQALNELNFIDTQNIVMGGQSRGGILSIAYAGEHPNEIKGVLNFVGGWMGEGCDFSSYINKKGFSRGSKFPQFTLWLYGKGDRFYSVAHSKSNFEACKRAGGKGSFYVFEVPSGRGHALISSPYLWRKEVIQYMRKIGFKEFY